MKINKNISILLFSLVTLNLSAQKDKSFVRQGNKLYENKKYSDAEVSYKKALEKQSNSISASYNLGNALYRQEKMQDAADQYARLADDKNLSKKQLGMVYHNMGNSLLQSKKIEESIDAYKKALRNNPADLETKYNLAFAQRLLKNQPKQKQQNKQDNKDQKDQNKKNDKDKKDKKQDQNQDQKKKNENQQQQQQQPQEGKLSKDAAKRMLEAIQNDEKNLKEKLEKQKDLNKKIKPDQDW
jgi:Ca-activated chloride channel homolog